jgi:hypothetical protein
VTVLDYASQRIPIPGGHNADLTRAVNLALTMFMIPFTCMVIAQVPMFRADDLSRPVDDVEQEGEVDPPKDLSSAHVVEMQTK